MTIWTIKNTGHEFVVNKDGEYYMRRPDILTAENCDTVHAHYTGRLEVFGVLAEYIRAGAPKTWTTTKKEATDEVQG